MNKDFTKILCIVDRSGSMRSMKEEAENGVNHFIEDQKHAPGRADITLVQFDNRYELVYQGPLDGCPAYVLQPRDCTALYDAMGKALTDVGKELAGMPEADRPGLVLVVVITDGMENASKEFLKSTVCAMVKEQTEKYNWQFTFLANDPTVLQQGADMGMEVQTSGGVYRSARNAMMGTSAKFTRMRGMSVNGATMDSLQKANAFTPAEAELIAEEGNQHGV